MSGIKAWTVVKVEKVEALRRDLDEISVEDRRELDDALDFAFAELCQWQSEQGAHIEPQDPRAGEQFKACLRDLQRALRMWRVKLDGDPEVSTELHGRLRDLQDTVTKSLAV